MEEMMQIYNKLVRDNIPKIITSNGEVPITRVLSDDEYKKCLEDKLYEEYKEVIESSGTARLEELADVLEIIRAMALLENSSLEEIIKIADNKRDKRGSFNRKIFLEKVIDIDKD